MKIVTTLRKPRNPLVAAARFRRAGSHQPDARTRRRLAGAALRREIAEARHPSP